MSELEVIKEGYMVKSPPKKRDRLGMLKHWRKRYIVLESRRNQSMDSLLLYFDNWQSFTNSSQCKGSIRMSDCSDVTMQSSTLFDRDFIVSLRTKQESEHKGRVFHFCANNQIEQKEWYRALENCIRKPVEQSDDDSETLDEHTEIYRPLTPTRLEKSIDTVKRKLSQVSLSDKLEHTNIDSRPYYKIGTDGNDSEDDEDCPFHGSVYLHTNEGIKDQESNRPNSKASSGYGSCPRDSTHSSSSNCDICRCSVASDGNLFEFSAQFEGPKCTTKVKTMLKAKSMGDLFDDRDRMSGDCVARRARRPSLMEQVDMILDYSAKKQSSSISLSLDTPHFSEEKTTVQYSQEKQAPKAISVRPRSLPGRLGSFGEQYATASPEINNGCRQAIPYEGEPVEHDRSNGHSSTGEKRDGQRRRSILSRRQCSRIEEKPEESAAQKDEFASVQVRSNSDPTSKKRSGITLKTLITL